MVSTVSSQLKYLSANPWADLVPLCCLGCTLSLVQWHLGLAPAAMRPLTGQTLRKVDEIVINGVYTF